MARSEARIAVTIWSDEDFLALSIPAQRMFLFLISQPDLAHDGVIALRERRWSKTAGGLTVDQVQAALSELEQTRFVVIDEDTEELLVRSFVRSDKVYRQPNVLAAAADHARGVSSGLILGSLLSELDRIMDRDDVPKGSVVPLREMRLGISERLARGSANPPGNPLIPTRSEGFDSTAAELAEPAAAHDQTAGREGSNYPQPKGSSNPTPGTLGERGVVTAVTTAPPNPVPPTPSPEPRSTPHSSSGGAGERATPPPAEDDPGPEPPTRCPNHIETPADGPCGPCGDARRGHDRWRLRDIAAQSRAESRANAERAEANRAMIEARQAAIAACNQCDERGYLAGGLCHHDPANHDRARRGAAAVREALQGGGR